MFFIRKTLTELLGIRLADRIKGYNVNEYYKLFVSSINWSRDQIESYQLDRLRVLLQYAYNYSSFFKERINNSGFNIEKLNHLDELKKIPPLTRNDLQNNIESIIPQKISLQKFSKGSSSGSTGHPVIYYHDKSGSSANKASEIFSKYLGGYRPGNAWINIWGNPTAVNVDWKKLSSNFKKSLMNETRYPAYRLNSKEQFEILHKLFTKKKPDFIYGYTNAIFLFAKFLEEINERLNYIKAVFTTAENLHIYQKEKIEKFLGPVYDQYGCSEINGIAVQSVYDEYYSILDPHVFVEYGDIIDKKNNIRKLIITDLHNFALPFIRYENGDLAVPAKINDYSNCKLKYSKFKSVDGRLSDIISLPGGGNLVVPSFFGSRMLKDVKGIKQYQVRKTNEKIIVNLIIDNNFKDESKKIILKTLDAYIQGEMKYEIVFNQDLIYSSNGKFKLFIDNSL